MTVSNAVLYWVAQLIRKNVPDAHHSQAAQPDRHADTLNAVTQQATVSLRHNHSAVMAEAIRQRIVTLCQAGNRPADVARSLGVNRSTVYRTLDLHRATGTVKKRYGGGRQRSKRTKAAVTAVKAKIARNPRRPIRQLAKQHKMSKSSMARLVREDLGMISRAVETRQCITESQKLLRVSRSRSLLSWLKSHPAVVRVFSDEKIFTVDAATNRRNTRYISRGRVTDVPDAVRISKKTKNAASVMVLGLIASDGRKCPPIFVPAGNRINAAAYQELLASRVLPWLKANFPDGNFVLQQDGAPPHSANSTQKFLRDAGINFWPKTLWPPSSPDLNPLDFSIWARVEAEACAKSHSSVEALKTAISRTWSKMDGEFIAKVCRAFRPRLQRVISADGGYIE